MTRKYNQGGLAPYGLRHSGEGVKGKGYFGPMAGRDGTVTELSAEDESGEFPLVVPTLTAEELDRLLAGGEPTPEMLDKASSWAATRRKRGESPFASPTEVRMPRPKAEGGSVYSPRPGLVFVGQEHGASADVPQEIRDLANQVGAFYEGSGGDKLPDIRYRGSWDDAASRSVKGYPPEYLYTIFTNTDVNKQKDALVGDGTIFNNLLKNQQQVGYFKDRRFNRKDLANFLQSMGPEFLRDSQNPATESNVEDFLKRGEQLMWESGNTSARQLADKANESRQRWLLNQPKGVFFMGSDHLQKLKELHGAGKKAPVKKAEGGVANLTDLPDEVNPSNWREHLQNNVLADARALLGVKDGGAISLDDLIEQALKKKDGGAINLDDLIDWTLAKAEHRKMKEGGAVKMQGGGNPGEVAGEMFKPKPLSIPEPITDLVEALRRQFEKEKRSMSKPGAVQDVLMRGPVAAYAGAPADILGMGGELLDYAQKKIPALRKPASVMDTGPEKTPPMGYAPMFPLSPEGSYGTTAAQEMMGKAGLTTGEERPLFEMGATAAAPIAGYAGFKAGKALAPTAMEMLDVELANMMKPYQMAVAPEGKAGKIKAPANPVGFYNPAEKAALNLQRKKGPGSAFISDLKKQPGVTDERIAELGLTDLASNPNVTREDVIAAVEQNRIPLRESVRRPYQESDEFSETADALKESIRFREGGIQQVQAELDRVRATAPDSPLVQQYENKIETMRESIARDKERLEGKKPSLYGPDSHPDYNMPGGENYREIRVSLPTANQAPIDTSGWKVVTTDNNEFTGQRFIVIYDENGNLVTQRSGFRGSDQEALDAATRDRQRALGADQNFYHRTHHGDEPNVLFHLRVADHVDEEGKRGLLIDELQSDWHQTGREKGYGPKFEDRYRAYYDTPTGQVNIGFGKTPEELDRMVKVSGWEGMPVEIKTEKTTAKVGQGVPEAPFKDNWYQLGLKRAIKEAADTGMDRVYLTTGARQNERYSLQKHVDKLQYEPSTQTLDAWKDGQLVISKTVPKDDLPSFVGKGAADKLLATELSAGRNKSKHELSGIDLDVGGAGMKQYYDKNYKNYLEKYAKQHGGKLGMTKIADGEPVYYIDLTDAMRESAKKGQSYAFGGGVFNTDPDITDSGRIIPEHTI